MSDPAFDAGQLAAWCQGTWRGQPAAMAGVCHDTRSLQPGNLFFAIRGEQFDGHRFVAEAFGRGAAACVVARGFAGGEAAPGALLIVDDTRVALLSAAAGYRASHAATFVGVTGSAGKTTVTRMMVDMLSAALPVGSTRGNWNNDIGLPLSLLTMRRSDRFGVFEVGTNHPGEIAGLCEVLRPQVGVITSIGAAHTEFFHTVDAVAHEKAALLRALPREGTAVLAADGPYFDRLAAAAPCRVLSVALSGEGDLACRAYDPQAGRCHVAERATGESAELVVPLPGRHHVANALLAAAVARMAGVSWSVIAAALRSFTPCRMRWEQRIIRGITIINDAYNANPLSMRAALDGYALTPVRGHKWLVLAGMLELGTLERGEHEELGEKVGAGAWRGLLTVGPLGDHIAEGARRAGMAAENIRRCADSGEAAAYLRDNVRDGDAVLLKGSRRMKLETIVDLLSA